MRKRIILTGLVTAALAAATDAPVLRPLDGGAVAVAAAGTKVWSDRPYSMTKWPDWLAGHGQFLRSPIRETAFEVLQPGYVVVLTPEHPTYSQAAKLLAAGFRYVDREPFHPYLAKPGKTGNSCVSLQKKVQPGDRVAFGYYGIALWSKHELPTNNRTDVPVTITIPTVDISQDAWRHSFVARGTEKVYQGHPCTTLLPDGKTMFCAWSINHAGHLGPLSRSLDGGKTWSAPLTVPDDWERVCKTTPTVHYLVGPDGKGRVFVMAGCDFPGRLRQAYSEDDGKTWTPMHDTGLKAECAPKSILSFDNGKRLVMWCDRRDPDSPESQDIDPVVFQSESRDGGLTWTPERIVVKVPTRWAQPAVIRSPDGKQLLMLLRYQGAGNGRYSVSNDNAQTWSEARELHPALTGHRPKALYAPDGRMVVVMRDTARGSKTEGHYVAWVGTYDDAVNGREGQYRIKLLHSHAGWDCGYSGFEMLPDGTFVATTYIKYQPGPEKHSVVTTRFRLEETDKL